MSSAPADTTYLRPTATDRVRLTVGAFEALAAVLEIEDDHVTLAAAEFVMGEGTILFSHPRGVIELQGALVPHPDGALFHISGQRRLEQRRGAFRLAVCCPVHIVRREGERLESRAGDLSVTGVRLLDAAELHDDEVVDLEIVLESGVTVEVAGQVVRRDAVSIGVTFHDLPHVTEAVLSRFVTGAQRRRLKPSSIV